MNLKIQLVNTKKEYKNILEIRKKVFVEEQDVPIEIEIEHENESFHVICFLDESAVATGRWRKTKHGIKLERFAVLKEYRNLGLGSKIVDFILTQVSLDDTIYLHAQEAVVNFYEKLGFKVFGEQFVEAGINHSKMIYER